MKVDPIIKRNIDELIRLCKRHKVNKLYVFGSVVSGHFDQKTSDIDLIAELEPMGPIVRGETLMELWNDLEDLFHKKVDLLTEQPIRNPYLKKSIERTKQLIYDGQSEKVFI